MMFFVWISPEFLFGAVNILFCEPTAHSMYVASGRKWFGSIILTKLDISIALSWIKNNHDSQPSLVLTVFLTIANNNGDIYLLS